MSEKLQVAVDGTGELKFGVLGKNVTTSSSKHSRSVVAKTHVLQRETKAQNIELRCLLFFDYMGKFYFTAERNTFVREKVP